jgi:hypothetical protein
MIWACPFRYFDKLSRSGRAVRSRFFLIATGLNPWQLKKRAPLPSLTRAQYINIRFDNFLKVVKSIQQKINKKIARDLGSLRLINFKKNLKK